MAPCDTVGEDEVGSVPFYLMHTVESAELALSAKPGYNIEYNGVGSINAHSMVSTDPLYLIHTSAHL